jgi:hypothetical protein
LLIVDEIKSIIYLFIYLYDPSPKSIVLSEEMVELFHFLDPIVFEAYPRKLCETL